jgi:hypothetical protein
VQDSSTFTESQWPGIDHNHPYHWLGDTQQLDLHEPRLRITAQKLTQLASSGPRRVAAIHDFVRRLPFDTCRDPGQVTAAQVLGRRRGDCHSKGLLFTALCRVAGVPARLQFVEVGAGFLAGILDEGPAVVTHAVGQVHVDGRWLSTDGYVVDPELFARAKALLRESGRDCGWGIVAEAQGTWTGEQDCLQQFRAGDVVRCHAPVHDVAQFHATGHAARGLTSRLKYIVGAHLVHRRAAALRQPA